MATLFSLSPATALARAGALSIVLPKLHRNPDDAGAAELALPVQANRRHLALRLVEAVEHAGLRAGSAAVRVRPGTLVGECAGWRLPDDVSASLLNASYRDDAEEEDALPTVGFAEFFVLRCVYGLTWSVRLEQRPKGDPALPPSGEEPLVTALWQRLAGVRAHLELEALRDEATRWRRVSDVVASVLRLAPATPA